MLHGGARFFFGRLDHLASSSRALGMSQRSGRRFSGQLVLGTESGGGAASSGRIECVPIATLESSDLQIGGEHGAT